MHSGIAAWVVVLGAMPAPAAAQGTAVVPLTAAEGSFAGLRPAAYERFQATGPAEVGDVNGDGVADVAIGEPGADPLGRRDAGAVRIVFGGGPLGRIDVRRSGFEIAGPRQGRRRPVPVFAPHGPPAGAMAGTSVAGAGDVNGDGLADVVVGAPFAGRRGRAFSGSAYVVFGKRSTGRVDLDRLGSAGLRIDGPRRDAAAGYRVAGPGDVNGDGRPDVIVSAAIVQRPTAYVVLGRPGTAAVDLRRLGRRGYALSGGRRALGDVGSEISGAGDFNGDGVADLAVSATQAPSPRYFGGSTFVVFGGPRTDSLDLEQLGERGVRIDGEHEFAYSGGALAPLGDVNGDGRGDLLVGATGVSVPGRRSAGAAYVVFGQAAAGRVDLARPGPAAYRILGASSEEQAHAGATVAAIDDVNGDGLRDMLIGAPGDSRECAPEEGAAYVVFSQNLPVPLDMENLGAAGYAIRGGAAAEFAGASVASAGDWNRDGRGDALVLSRSFDDRRRGTPPRLDLLLGRDPPPVPAAQPPSIELVRPILRRLFSRRGIEARVTASEPGPVLVLLSANLGGQYPLAFAYPHFSAPGTRTVKLAAPRLVRRVLSRRTHLNVRVLVSHCTAAGHEYAATSRLELR